jgi:hypothetical protein
MCKNSYAFLQVQSHDGTLTQLCARMLQSFIVLLSEVIFYPFFIYFKHSNVNTVFYNCTKHVMRKYQFVVFYNQDITKVSCENADLIGPR